jgi:hypothetical protein
VTQAAGLDVEMYGMGVAAADYDNDGRVDVYLTGLGGNKLFRNAGDGKFADVTTAAGVGGGGFSTSAVFFDYDKDGRLDLFVSNYVEWSIDKDLYCTLDGKTKSYCTPESYKGRARCSTATWATAASRTSPSRRASRTRRRRRSASRCSTSTGTPGSTSSSPTTRSPTSCSGTGGDGRFKDVGTSAGVAFSEAGVARAGMGVDAADYDGSGRPSLVIGNFSNEMMALYHNEGNGPLHRRGADVHDRQGVAAEPDVRLLLLRLRPGRAAGHLRAERPRRRRHRDGAAEGQVRAAAAPVPQPGREALRSGRLALGRGPPAAGRGSRRRLRDYDNDGDLDVLVTTNGGPARLLRNDGGNANHFLRIRTQGTALEPRRHRCQDHRSRCRAGAARGRS